VNYQWSVEAVNDPMNGRVGVVVRARNGAAVIEEFAPPQWCLAFAEMLLGEVGKLGLEPPAEEEATEPEPDPDAPATPPIHSPS
jgi:hypothetical protein